MFKKALIKSLIMESVADHIGILIKLGLSSNQAKVYIGTLKTGIAAVKDIAKCSRVGREDVYRLLPTLQELGLIRQHLGTPAKYEAVEPCEAIEILLSKKDQESAQLKTEATTLLQLSINNDDFADNCPKTIIVSRDNSSGVDTELIDLIRNVKSTLDFTTRYSLFSTAFNEKGLTKWINEMYYAAERGIKFRMIMDTPVAIKPMSELSFSVPNSKRLLTHPNFDYRYVSEPPACIMIQFDDQACCIETECQKKHKMSPYMITNNPVFIALNRAYFESMWNQALTEKQWKHRQERSIQ
jgi:predicted transcriptional regulator